MERVYKVMSTEERNRLLSDRISSLPDCLLHVILSFLDTKFAVRTGSLSKRWVNVWSSSPYLVFSYYFDEIANVNTTPADTYNKLYKQMGEGFSNCVLKVLDARNGYDVNKIVVRCDLILESKFLKSVMSHALKHKAKEIEIMADTDESDPIVFPESIYTSTTLEKLVLIGDPYDDPMYLSSSMGFRTLKELRLHLVAFSREGLNVDIFPQCLVLETLSLVGCEFDHYYPVEISVPRLMKLEMSFLITRKLRFGFFNFVISAPMLSYFKFESPEPMEFTLEGCTSSVKEIEIDIMGDFAKEGDIRGKWIVERLIKMLSEFRNAKSVSITLNTLKILSMIPKLLRGQESPFAKLENLHLKTNWSELAPGWNFLLKNSPNVNASLQGDLNKVDISKL